MSMSNKYINDAITQARAINDPAAAHILLVLANHVTDQGEWALKHETLARETSYGEKTVRRKLDLLRDQGRIEWDTIKNSRAKTTGNRYRLILSKDQKAADDRSPVTNGQRDHRSNRGGTIGQNEQGPSVTRDRPLPSKNHHPRSTLKGESAPSARPPADEPPINGHGQAKRKEESGCPTNGVSRKPRATPLPSEWAPSRELEQYGLSLGLTLEGIAGGGCRQSPQRLPARGTDQLHGHRAGPQGPHGCPLRTTGHYRADEALMAMHPCDEYQIAIERAAFEGWAILTGEADEHSLRWQVDRQRWHDIAKAILWAFHNAGRPRWH
jgi:hypothetical protein